MLVVLVVVFLRHSLISHFDALPSDASHPQPSDKCGVLNVTKITEHGKKVR